MKLPLSIKKHSDGMVASIIDATGFEVGTVWGESAETIVKCVNEGVGLQETVDAQAKQIETLREKCVDAAVDLRVAAEALAQAAQASDGGES